MHILVCVCAYMLVFMLKGVSESLMTPSHTNLDLLTGPQEPCLLFPPWTWLLGLQMGFSKVTMELAGRAGWDWHETQILLIVARLLSLAEGTRCGLSAPLQQLYFLDRCGATEKLRSGHGGEIRPCSQTESPLNSKWACTVLPVNRRFNTLKSRQPQPSQAPPDRSSRNVGENSGF